MNKNTIKISLDNLLKEQYCSLMEIAISQEDVKAIKTLTNYGYRVNRNHLFYAIKRNKIEMFKILYNLIPTLDKNDEESLMYLAVHYGRITIMKLLHKFGFSIDCYSMSQAVDIDNIPIIKLLLEWGAPFDKETILRMINEKDTKEIYNIFQQYGYF